MRNLAGFMLAAALLLPGRLIAGVPSSSPVVDPDPAPRAGRLVMFIGVDISGSFMNDKYFDDSIEFLARYIHAHLNGLGGMEVPHSLFVGSIGGVKRGEAKTLFPIQTFQDRTVEQIET